MHQLQHIQNTLLYIKSNFHNEIAVSEIEKVSNYSYRNIQRIFKNVFGENLKSFQRRLRLEKAYKKMVYTQDSISDIALNVGYGNLQSFSKAFSKHFKISPSQARLNKKKIFEEFIVRASSKIEIEKIYKEKQTIYCRAIKSYNYNNNEIDEIWKDIELKNQDIVSFEAYGIIVDQPLITNHRNCIYEFAISKISSQNSGFVWKEIFGGYYLKFTHFGSFDYIEETYKNFYKYWLCNLHLELGDSEIIEHYISLERECNGKESYVTHIYFPLK